MPDERPSRARPSSLANALHLLELFTSDEPELSATDIARKLNIAPSTVHRLTVTLMGEGFLTRDPRTRRYRLGIPILALTQVIVQQSPLYQAALPLAEELVQCCNETVQVAMLRDLRVVTLLRVNGMQAVPVRTRQSNPHSVHCTAAGQVLLAHQAAPPDEWVPMLRLRCYTASTITDPGRLMERLGEVREQGYAICCDEQYGGVAAIAVPIRHANGSTLAALSITGRTEAIERAHRRLLSLALRTADRVAQAYSQRERT